MQDLMNELIRSGNTKRLRKALKALTGYEIAEFLNNQPQKFQLRMFKELPENLTFECFDYLSQETQNFLLHALPSYQAAKLLKSFAPDDRTAFLEVLPKETVDEFVKLLPISERLLTLKLLGYPEKSIGRLMTTDYLAVLPHWTIEKVLDHIKEYGHDSETIDYIYVIDYKGRLIDDIKLRDLLFISRNKRVESILNGNVIALSVKEDEERAINVFRMHDRSALPVIDNKGVLLGIVTIDDILRLSDEEATEDIQKIGGMEALDKPYMQAPFLELIKKRAGWLVILFLGEMMTATALGYFEKEIAQAVVLALFLPLVISSGGNAGSQAATLIIRAMALEEVKLKDWWKIVKRECASGVVLGLILGLIGFLRVIIWSQFSNIYGDHWFLIALTIYFSLIGVILWGTFSGAVLPLVLRYFRFDPATSSAPFIATMVDVVGLIIYFMVAIFLLKGTLL
ncbi:magnesium transporter [Candidatus Protochlamydia sp. W-9]|uniref:magnesium transporter n=1 Tax=Candidatus Protochlamydia sp. W-9 TaxID=1785087 RepID=UPI00096A720F|nr:magnesium transporter [Candidatus Protochlamydia sp. W-9]